MEGKKQFIVEITDNDTVTTNGKVHRICLATADPHEVHKFIDDIIKEVLPEYLYNYFAVMIYEAHLLRQIMRK